MEAQAAQQGHELSAAARTADALRATPLPGAPFGVELEIDIDPSRLFTNDQRLALRRLLAVNDVIVVRGGISAEQQLALCGAFAPVLPQGPRAVIHDRPPLPQPEVIHLSNVLDDGALGNDALGYHHEFAYLPTPCVGISLYAEDIEDGQCGTRFVSGRLAYGRLPLALHERLDRLQGLFVAQFDAGIRKSLGRHRDAEVDPRYPRAVHPVVIPHPITDEPVLYVNNSQTDRILGLPEHESEGLLQTLFDHMYDERNVYEHRYRPGDLVLWDNLNVQHGRAPAEPSLHRTLRRVIFGAKAPWEEWPYEPPHATLINRSDRERATKS